MTSHESNPKSALDEARTAKRAVLALVQHYGFNASVGIGTIGKDGSPYCVKVSLQEEIDRDVLPKVLGSIPVVIEYVGEIKAQDN